MDLQMGLGRYVRVIAVKRSLAPAAVAVSVCGIVAAVVDEPVLERLAAGVAGSRGG